MNKRKTAIEFDCYDSKYSIIVLSIWIGKLPNSLPLWITSVGANQSIDFLLITDDSENTMLENVPNNLHIRHETFSELKNVFKKNLIS